MGRYSAIRQEWTGLVEQWRVSGLSGVEFCRREQLDVMRFYRWCRRLLSRSGDTAGDGFVPIRFSGEGGRCGIAVVIGQHPRGRGDELTRLARKHDREGKGVEIILDTTRNGEVLPQSDVTLELADSTLLDAVSRICMAAGWKWGVCG